jgi:hypothetical protein
VRRICFGLPRFVVVAIGAAVWPPILPIRIAATIVSLASSEVFSVRGSTLIAEFLERVSGGAKSIGRGAQGVDQAALSPTLPHSLPPGGNRPAAKFRR